jgi:DNA-binding GntR family transcriptional regulator
MIMLAYFDEGKEWPHRLCAMNDDGTIKYSVISRDMPGAIKMMARHIDRTEEEITTMLRGKP